MTLDAAAILSGDRRAIARGLTEIESGGPAGVTLLDAVWSKTGRARRVGVTGPPGAGKSSLVAGLVRMLRGRQERVGVICVDPTSPFTGGALLGDRHRMSREAFDDSVFVRSLATRGNLGGLSRSAPAALDLLDAAGFDSVIVETVGVGQSEVEVVATADTIVVVLSPESGDAVQAMKAGLLEVADVLCVNKADRDGADEMALALSNMLDLREGLAWRPLVVKTNALLDIAPLTDAIDAHQAWLGEDGRLGKRRRDATMQRLRWLVGDLATERLLRDAEALLEREVAAVHAGSCSVAHAAQRAVEEILA